MLTTTKNNTAQFCLYLLLILSVLSTFGCKKENRKEIPFVTYVDIHPAGLDLVRTHHFKLRAIPGIPYEKLIEAQPAYVRLSLEYGEGTLNFLRDVTFDAITDSSKQEVAYYEFIPVLNQRDLDLYPSIVDLKEHVQQKNFDMMLNIELRSIPSAETRVRIDFGILGIMEEE